MEITKYLKFLYQDQNILLLLQVLDPRSEIIFSISLCLILGKVVVFIQASNTPPTEPRLNNNPLEGELAFNDALWKRGGILQV
jgi:uncharacterized membrane protein